MLVRLTLALAGLWAAPTVAAACVSPPPEGPPPIISWCRPVPWGGCLPSPVNNIPDTPHFLVLGGYTTGGAQAGDTCQAGLGPLTGFIESLDAVLVVDANTGRALDSFKFRPVEGDAAVFEPLGTTRHHWREARAEITAEIPAGQPVSLVFRVTAAEGTSLARDVRRTLVGSTKVGNDGALKHLALTHTRRSDDRPPLPRPPRETRGEPGKK